MMRKDDLPFPFVVASAASSLVISLSPFSSQDPVVVVSSYLFFFPFFSLRCLLRSIDSSSSVSSPLFVAVR